MHFEFFDLLYVLVGVLGGGGVVMARYNSLVKFYNARITSLENVANGLFEDLRIERNLTEGLAQTLDQRK